MARAHSLGKGHQPRICGMQRAHDILAIDGKLPLRTGTPRHVQRRAAFGFIHPHARKQCIAPLFQPRGLHQAQQGRAPGVIQQGLGIIKQQPIGLQRKPRKAGFIGKQGRNTIAPRTLAQVLQALPRRRYCAQ